MDEFFATPPTPEGKGEGDREEPVWTYRGYRLKTSEFVTAMVHLFRAEIQRANVWRQRLDTTTSWAITVTSSIFTVAFSFRDVPHLIFFFNIAVVWVLLWIEARRYRFYDAFRARVRMLEAHFLVPIVLQNASAVISPLRSRSISGFQRSASFAQFLW